MKISDILCGKCRFRLVENFIGSYVFFYCPVCGGWRR